MTSTEISSDGNRLAASVAACGDTVTSLNITSLDFCLCLLPVTLFLSIISLA